MDIQRRAPRLALSVCLLLGVIVIAPLAADGPSVRAAEPSLSGKPVDCDDPKPDETVVETTAELENALRNIGGTIAAQPGTYPIKVNIFHSVRLTSCDFDDPALVTTTGGSSNWAIITQQKGTTLHVHDIDFSMVGKRPLLLSATDGAQMIVDGVNFDHVDGLAFVDDGSAVSFTSGAFGEVFDSNFANVGRGISAFEMGDLTIDNVVIEDTTGYGIFLYGARAETSYPFNPKVRIVNATVIGAGRVDASRPGINIVDADLRLDDSQVGCGNSINLSLVAAPGSVGPFDMRVNNVNVGFIEGGLAPEKCVNGSDGVSLKRDVDVSIDRATIKGHDTNRGLVVAPGTTDVVVGLSTVKENKVGVAHDGDTTLSDVQVVGNDQDCLGTGVLTLAGETGDSDGTCTGGGLNPDGSVNCDNPPAGVTVVPDDVADLGAALNNRGIIAMRPGTYTVRANITSGSAELTSCDRGKPAVVRNQGSDRQWAILVENGAQLNVHHIDMELYGNQGLLLGAASGANLVVDNVRMTGMESKFGIEDKGIQVVGKATATLTNTKIRRLGRGIQAFESGDITMDFVEVSESAESGIWLMGTSDEGSSVFNPDILITNSTSMSNGQNLGSGAGILSSDVDLTVRQTAVACNANMGVRLTSRSSQPGTSIFDNVRIGVPFEPIAAIVRNGLLAQDAGCTNGNVGLSVTNGARVEMTTGVIEVGQAQTGVDLEAAGPSTPHRFDRTTIQNSAVGVKSSAAYVLEGVRLFDNGSDCGGEVAPTLVGFVPNDGSCGEDQSVGVRIAAVDGLTEIDDGEALRADAGEAVVFRVTTSEPIVGEPLIIPWTIEGNSQVHPKFLALDPSDISNSVGTVTMQPGETTQTFSVVVAADDVDETAGFTIWVGDDSGQSIDGLLVGRRVVTVEARDAGDGKSALVVAEGDPIKLAVTVSPADPFVDASRALTWTLEPGVTDGIDADDVAALSGRLDIDFDPAEDRRQDSVRLLDIATLQNTGDLGSESFTFTASLREGDVEPAPVASGSIDGRITDVIGTTITAVGGLTESTAGALLRADAGGRIKFRVDIDEPNTGAALDVPWQIVGAADVVPGFRAITANEIVEEAGTAQIKSGETSTTFEVLIADIDLDENLGFRIRIGDGPKQEVVGMVVARPLLIVTEIDEAVDEGDPINVDVRLSPANPFLDGAEVVAWTLAPGAVNGIDSDDVEALAGTVNFVFDPATDAANTIDRTVSIPTLLNTGDALLESFDFQIEVRNPGLGADPLTMSSADGEIADSVDGVPTVTARPADEWQLRLADGTDAVVLVDNQSSSVEIDIDGPRTTLTQLSWSIEGAVVEGERAASTTSPGNDFEEVSGQVSIPAGETTTTLFLRSEPDAADEPHEGFILSITNAAGDVVSIPGLIETDSFSVKAAPADGGAGDILLAVPAEGAVEAAVTVTPAPLLPTSFVQEWQVLGNGTFGDGTASASDFSATTGSLDLGLTSNRAGDTLSSVTRQLSIDVVDDGEIEPSEGFELVLPATEGNDSQVLLGVIYDGATPTAEEGTSFGGLKVTDVKGEVEPSENGPTGTAGGKIKLPSFDLEVPVDIVFADGAVTVTYEASFDDINLSSGEGGAERDYLRIEDPAVKVQAKATSRGKVTAFVEVTAGTGVLFPDESPGMPVGARVDDLSVTINSSTVIVMSARQVSGRFGTIDVTGPNPRLIISPDPTVPLLSVGEITTSGGFTLTGLTIARDGSFDFDEACLEPNDWLNGGLDVIGLPVDITESCVFSTKDGTRAQIAGSFDDDALALLGATATVTIGDGDSGSFDTLFDLDTYSFTPRDLGPINITLEEFETNGYTVSGSFEIAGYSAGVLDPSFDGEFTIETPGDGTVKSQVDGNITTVGNGLTSTTAIEVFLATAADNIGLESDLLTVPSASLGLNFGYETTETTTLSGAVPDPDDKRLLDLFRPDASSDDFMNGYILAVLNYYLYLDSYGLRTTPSDATFAAVALRPAVESLGGELVDFFSDDNGVQGAIIRTDDVLLVVGRGSDATEDYVLQAVGALPNDTGEHGAVAEAADVVQNALDAALAERGNRKLWVSGHSYGGSLTSIVVGRLPESVVVDGFVTFGAPTPFTSERNALEALDPDSALMQATRWTNQSDPIPLLYLPGVYFHPNDPSRIVVAPNGSCSVEPTQLEVGAGIDADDHSIGRYAHRIFNLAPADVRAAVLSTQRTDMTITVVPVGDVISGGGAECDEAQPFTKLTETTITGPVVTSAGAEVALRIPGLTDDAGQAVEVEASVAFDAGKWTAEPVLDPDVAYRFGGLELATLTGVLVVDTNTGASTPIEGSFTAGVTIRPASGAPITVDANVEFTSDAAGVVQVDVAGSVDFDGDLFGGALTVDTATLDASGSASFDAADISSSTLEVTARLVATGATLEFGVFEVDLGDIEFNYDGDDSTPLISLASVVGRIADPNDDSNTLLGVTITDFVVGDDLTVHVGSIDVRDLDDLQTQFALAGVLPYVVSRITLTTADGDFNAFTLNVEGDVNLDVFPDDLDVRFSVDNETRPQCSDPVDPEAPKQFSLPFSIEVTSARDFEFAPTEMSDMFLGVCKMQVGPVTVAGSIALGGYENGVYSGDVTADLGVRTEAAAGSIEVSAQATGDLQFLDNGAARLAFDSTFVVSGKLDDVVEVKDASIDVGFDIAYDPNGSPVVAVENIEMTGADVGSVAVNLGDFVTLESNGAALFPEPGVLVSVVGDDAFFSAVLGEDLGPLDGWGGRAGNFKVVLDAPGSATGVDVELHPGFFIEIDADENAKIGLPDWLPFVVRDAGISWPELALGQDGLTVTEPVTLGSLVSNIGEAEILFSGGLSSEGSDLPFDAQVDGLRIDIGALTRFVDGNSRPGDSVIKGLDGIKFGMERTEFGPLTVGGTVSFGSVEVGNGAPIYYLEIKGSFGFDGIEVAGQLVVSEYGPVALEFSAPLAVPLGPSGFMLAGVSGGVDFLSEFGPATVCKDGVEECARQEIQIDCDAEAVGSDGEEGLLCGSSPLDLLDDQAFPIGEFTFDSDALAADIAKRIAKGSPLIPQRFTIRLGGTLTHVGAAGLISGEVNLAVNLSTGDDGGLKFLGSGSISAAGVSTGADARFLIDLTSPFEPIVTIAGQVPTTDDWIAAVLPVKAQVGITVDTKGLAPGMVLALRQFLIESARSGAVTEVVLPRLAAVLEADHRLATSELLLDIDGNGQVSPTEDAATITTEFILDRLVDGDDPLLVDWQTAGSVGAVIDSDMALALRVTNAVISDIFTVLDPDFVEEFAASGVVFDFEPITAEGARALLADFLATAQDALVGDGTPENTGALGVLLATANPKLLIDGQIQVEAFGLPIGSRKALTVYIDKEQLIFEATGSIWEELRNGCAIPGCSQFLYFALLGLNDETSAAVSVPFKLENLLTGGDAIDGSWAVGLSSELTAFGLPLGTSTGFIVPAGNRTFIDSQIDGGGFVIPVSAKQRDAIAARGGVMFEGNLRLPNFVTNPANVIKDLSDKCTTVPDELTGIPGWITDCFDIATNGAPIGAVQGYLPAPDFSAFDLSEESETKLDDLRAEVGAQLSIAYLQGTLGNPDTKGDGTVDEGEPFRILGLQLGQAEVSASTAGLSVRGEVPVLGSPVTFDVILPSGPDDPENDYPRVGATLELDSDGVARAVNGLGFGEIINLKGIEVDGRFEAYSPGFDTTADATALQRSGGIQLKLTANVAIAGVIEVERAEVLVEITPSSTGVLNVVARVSVDSVEVGGFTVTDSAVEFSLVDGEVSGSLQGSVALPEGFSDGNGDATLEVEGSFSNGEYALGVGANSVKIGAVSLSGAVSISGNAERATLEIGPVGDAAAAIVSVDGLATVQSSGISVSSDGTFSVNLSVAQLGRDAIRLTGLDATISGGIVDGDYVMGFRLAPGAKLRIRPLSSVGETVIDFPAIDKTVGLRDLQFSHSFTIPAIQLGSFMETSEVFGTVRFDGTTLSLRQERSATIEVLGATATITGLRVDTDGNVVGRIAGDLSVFDNTLADLSIELDQKQGADGSTVLELSLDEAEMNLPLINASVKFNGFIRSNGEFRLDGSSSAQILTPRVKSVVFLGVTVVPGIAPVVLASYSADLVITNVGGFSAVADAEVCLLGECGVAMGTIDSRGLVSGIVRLPNLGVRPFSFPRGVAPLGAPDQSVPEFTNVPTDIVEIVPDTVTRTRSYYTMPTATDATSVDCFPARGAWFDLGTTTVRCAATGNGQSAYAQFRVTVLSEEFATSISALNGQLSTNGNGSFTVHQGEGVTGAAGGYRPLSEVSATVFSDPISLGATTADGDGLVSWSVIIPSEMPVGEHTLVLRGETVDGIELLHSFPVDVQPASAAPGGEVPVIVEPGGELPATGSSGTSTIVWLAVVFLLLGSLLLLGRHRRPPRVRIS